MNEESFIDANSLLDRAEKWARESLQNNGYSHAFIGAWIEVDDGLELEDALELITSECDYKLLLIRHIQYLRDRLSNGDQSPIDWILDGYMISWFHHEGSFSESEKVWFSELQSERAKRPRNRTSVAKRAVEYILREAPEFPATVPLRGLGKQIDLDNIRKDAVQKRGRDLARFRHFVGAERRLFGKNIDIEVTAIEDDDGKVIEYDIFDSKTNERNILKEATIRSIIFRLKNQPSEKNARD